MDSTLLQRAQSKKERVTIPEEILGDFHGFTHVRLRIYCRKIEDPQRKFKKTARPYEGFIFVHLTDCDDLMDEYPFCMLMLHHCTPHHMSKIADKILACTSTLKTVLTTRQLSM